ncbi:MAG: hypothetical protein P0S96_01185 [Simkaniaceae bacterium]|nr:hypothetical protein [Candidatus Sacchlamyda saccharinae]
MNYPEIKESFKREVFLFLDNKKGIGDFISRFYLLFDDIPSDCPGEIIEALESFDTILSRYEPDEDTRKAEKYFIDHGKVQIEAKLLFDFLKKI